MKKIIKIPNANFKDGFITHDDQEKDGLSFQVVFNSPTHLYIVVEGTLAKGQKWLDRVGGTVLTKEEAAAEVEPLLPDTEMCDRGFAHPFNKVAFFTEVKNKMK